MLAAKELDKYLDVEADETKVAEIKDAKKAYALLLTLLDDDILATMSSESCACEIWNSLKNKYLKVSAVSQILVQKKLSTLKKRRDCSMQSHIHELLAIVNELRLSGAEVKHMDVIIYLLMSLPAEYNIIKSTIENQPNEMLMLGFIIQRLLNAEELQGERNSYNSRVSGSSNNVAFSTDKHDIICHKCKSKGHIAKFCKRKLVCFGCGHPGHYKKDCSAELWHSRMGHSSDKILKEMGLPVSESPSRFCEECVLAKHSNTPMNKGPRSREHVPMRMVHTDICGPIILPTKEGEKYFATIIDNFSRFTELAIASVMTDPAPPHSPPLNGVAERANRYLLEKARALICEAKLSKSFWGYAVQTAAYLKNRIANQTVKNLRYELKYEKPLDLNIIKVFGSDAYMRVPDNLRNWIQNQKR
ncbi:Copia protein, partial [Stegodyphus mimosarum]